MYHVMNNSAEDPKAQTDRYGNVNMADFLRTASYHRALNDR